jgi:hypothetical protein
MVAWLDGMSPGEQRPDELLEILSAKGAAAVNIVPDRNWNLSDREEQDLKRGKLLEFVQASRQRNLPINIGTEMNKLGLPFVDDLDGAFLSQFREDFERGAEIMVGQSVLLRYADFSYVGDEAAGEFGADVTEKNDFFASVGGLPPLDSQAGRELSQMGSERAFSSIRDAVKRGRWET